MVVEKKNTILVNSKDVKYTDDEIISEYRYETTLVDVDCNGNFIVTPKTTEYTFKTKRKIPRFGLMLVGWGGNNGSTVTASILANKYGFEWKTREGVKSANYYGSIMMSSTTKLGTSSSGKDINVPFESVLPTVHPNDFIIGGWDINSANIAAAMERACVLEPDLQRQLYPHLEKLKPMPSIYYPDYIAANQLDRADNLINGTKQEHLDRIRHDIREFKETNSLESIVVVWTANTERYSSIISGVNDTAENLLNSIKNSHEEVAPSTIFAVACILENVPFLNGSPQNTFVPGCIELAEIHESFIGGDDFKSGQTKIKSVLADFLVNAGLKPIAISSYNHLGNNDGKNLSAPAQFKSKEISKSSVVDDIVQSNPILYQV
jgi:myo-inositol-1-phosphate synthase